MASNFPDPTANNPDTGALWTTGDTWTDPESGVSYVYDPDGTTPIWKTSHTTTAAADARYVEIAGDNMTGNLTLGPDGGPPEVQVRRSFSGTPATVEVGQANAYIAADGRIVAHADVTATGPELFITNANVDTTYIHANSHGLSIGGEISAAVPEGGGTINLRADGSAEFAGIIDTEGVRGSFISPQVPVDSSDATWGLFSGKDYNGNVTSQIKGDGNASFAGAITSSVLNAKLLRVSGEGLVNDGIYCNYTGAIPDNQRFLTIVRRGTPLDQPGVVLYPNSIYTSGTVTPSNVILNLEPDNDANYVTTTDVDEEGNTFENRVYNGPTLDVKERLQNLLARVDAMEANELIDDATDSSLLTLVSNLDTRLSDIEIRLAALEGVS